MSHHSTRLTLATLMLSAASISLPASARTLGQLDFKACSLALAQSADTVSAQCSTLKVPENPAAPKGRQIELAIAWIPAKGEAEPDPVFMIAGGPGQSALESYPQLHQAFADIRKNRHIILVDQRGTGKSNRLICKDASGKSSVSGDDEDFSLDKATTFSADCAKQLSAKADPRFYSTSDAIDDLELVRKKINAPSINLYGVSYGTRVAQQFAKRYPKATRSVVLDGVVPNTLILGSDHASNLESALDLHFARCAADKTCKANFGNVRERLNSFRAQISKSPMPVNYTHPVSGEAKQGTLSAGHLASVMRLYSYSPLTASMLPMFLAQASKGNAGPLMAQSEMLKDSVGDSIMHGMQLSVICAEDAAELKSNPKDADTLLGNQMVEFMQAQCKVWPHGKRPADFRKPLSGNVPVLILSGEFDPVTPPRYGNEVLKSLPNARHLIFKGQGHNVMPISCGPKLFASFINTADAKKLDAKCLDRLSYVPMFTSFYGWEP
jgi:pimeloyl-ACP methyl ester carboxylesterase